jgi:ribosome-associated protein
MSITSDELVSMAAKAAEDKKAMNIIALNIKGLSIIADYFLICHGNSDVQVQAIATEIKKKAEEKGQSVRRIEGFDSARWVLVDLGDVVVHVFHRDEREFYNLERLWSDAKVVELV